MALPSDGGLAHTHVFAVSTANDRVRIAPTAPPRFPGVFAGYVANVLLTWILPVAALIWLPTQLGPDGQKLAIAFMSFMPFLVGLMFVLLRSTHRDEHARGPILELDTTTNTVSLPRLGISFPKHQVVALQVIKGSVTWTRDRTLHQLAVVYRAPDGSLRRRLITEMFADSETGLRWFRSERLLSEFSAATGIPFYSDWIRGTKVRRELIERYLRPTSDAFDLPLDAPPIIDPKHARPDTSQLTPIPTPPPFCRRCGYVFEGPTVPPRCPECGIDFTKHPNART